MLTCSKAASLAPLDLPHQSTPVTSFTHWLPSACPRWPINLQRCFSFIVLLENKHATCTGFSLKHLLFFLFEAVISCVCLFEQWIFVTCHKISDFLIAQAVYFMPCWRSMLIITNKSFFQGYSKAVNVSEIKHFKKQKCETFYINYSVILMFTNWPHSLPFYFFFKEGQLQTNFFMAINRMQELPSDELNLYWTRNTSLIWCGVYFCAPRICLLTSWEMRINKRELNLPGI